MHPSISDFTSKEFYNSKLKTGLTADERPLTLYCFPWPNETFGKNGRAIFLQCSTREEIGQKSKTNMGQARACFDICKLLTKPDPASAVKSYQSQNVNSRSNAPDLAKQTIAVLAPYARKAEELKAHLAGISQVEVSSIDGYQGREADIIVFVTVRCNEKKEIGFLKDLRRMNVALRRGRAGLIVIGDRTTLTQGSSDEASIAMWKRLLGALTPVNIGPFQ